MFEEKPARPRPIPGRPDRAYASMGNYLFSRDTLVEALLEDAGRPTEHDFGRSIIPALTASGGAYAYDFQSNRVPGVRSYEEPGYWRDVGTIESYWRAHMDLLGDTPRLDLSNAAWPILGSRYDGPGARVIGGQLDNVHVGEGSLVRHATLRSSLLGRGVVVDEGCFVEDSIVMDGTRLEKGVRLRRVIVDRFNVVPRSTAIGEDPAADAQRYFVDRSGIVVLPRGGRAHVLDYGEDG
jgi:glucose-1-phosphate adenylyltransferase